MVWLNVALALIALIAYLILKIVEAVTGTVREIQTEIEKTEKEILLPGLFWQFFCSRIFFSIFFILRDYIQPWKLPIDNILKDPLPV